MSSAKEDPARLRSQSRHSNEFLTTTIVIVATGIMEGALFAEIVSHWRHPSLFFLGLAGLGAIVAYYMCRHQRAGLEPDRALRQQKATGERHEAGALETSLPEEARKQ